MPQPRAVAIIPDGVIRALPIEGGLAPPTLRGLVGLMTVVVAILLAQELVRMNIVLPLVAMIAEGGAPHRPDPLVHLAEEASEVVVSIN